MEIQDTISIIIGVLGIGGIIFTIYNTFKNPQVKLEKDQALQEAKLDSKATALAQQYQWEKEANERRFCEMNTNLKEAMTMAQNHIHTVNTKVDGMKSTIEQMGKDIVQLSTIINERIPKK